jgi:hypothetical protein
MKRFHVQLVSNESSGLGTGLGAVCERLESTPRLQLELDGSFVWVGDQWQLDGMIYDRDEQLQYVDLKGECPLGNWRELMAILVRETTQISVVMLPEGGLYDLQTFEKLTWV